MDRIANILKYANTSGKGIEIAPYFTPIVPKRDGFDVLIVDVCDTEELRKSAASDPLIPKERVTEIEEVDCVGDASHIAKLLVDKHLGGQIDYVVSSHNFEHLPNPVLFLKGIEDVLKPGGFLSFAVPDCRACFDHFRLPTRLSDWLRAYHENASQPSPESVFDQQSNFAAYVTDAGDLPGCGLGTGDPQNFELSKTLEQDYQNYLSHKQNGSQYIDVHCNVFFPQILELLILDLRHLGLIGLDIVEVSQTIGHEFFVHLQKPTSARQHSAEEFYRKREELMRAISWELGASPYRNPDMSLYDFAQSKMKTWKKRAKNRIRDVGRRLRGKRVV